MGVLEIGIRLVRQAPACLAPNERPRVAQAGSLNSCFLIAGGAAQAGGIVALLGPATMARSLPIARTANQAVLHRFVTYIVEVGSKSCSSSIVCSPGQRFPAPRRRARRLPADSPLASPPAERNRWGKLRLKMLHRAEEFVSPWGIVQIACRWSGSKKAGGSLPKSTSSLPHRETELGPAI